MPTFNPYRATVLVKTILWTLFFYSSSYKVLSSPNIHVIIQRYRLYVIGMFSSQMVDHVNPSEGIFQSFSIPYIPNDADVRKACALLLIKGSYVMPSTEQCLDKI